MVASLFVATSVFAQDCGTAKPCAPKCEPKCPPKPCPKPCPQPCPPTQICPGDPCCPAWPTPVLNAAYNYPARMQTRCPWDINFDASFIYWQPVQENMELAVANTLLVASTGISGNVVNMDFNYKPGFKVGMGGYFDYDGWDLHGEYTWFHGNQKESTATGGSVVQLLPMWGNPGSNGNATYTSISEKWRLNMDIADLDLGRWYYVGTKLTFRPNFGARAAWIRQNVTVTNTNATTVNTVTGKSRSWAIGAKTGLDTNWDLGYGFRMFGNGEADLLFTKYTRLSSKSGHVASPVVTTADIHVKQKRVYAVKPHLDLELGFGWGTYLDCNNWYMDFSAGYGFQVFFDQNMFRHFNDDIMDANSTLPNGNLYVHGLTMTFKLDF